MVLSDTKSRGAYKCLRNFGISRHVRPLPASLDGLLNLCLPLFVRGLGAFNFALMRAAQFADKLFPITFDPRKSALRDVEAGRFASAAVTNNGRPHCEWFGPRPGSPYTSRCSNQARSNAEKRRNNMIDGGAAAVGGVSCPFLPSRREDVERERWQFTTTII